MKKLFFKLHYIIIISLFCIVNFYITAGCKEVKMLYSYADGSGNVYTVSSEEIKYSPVRPEFSSSGIYSGGEPKKNAIDVKQYEEFKKLIDKALQDKAFHIPNRVKMSGLIRVYQGDKIIKKGILKPRCKYIYLIEKTLKKMLK